ncbi:MAG: M23 family metallopeptidase [Acidimicrobiia bacterium]
MVDITVEPTLVYVEEGRHGRHLNFDFLLSGLTDRNLELVFLKVAVYDDDGLVTYRYLNRNAVGPAGIHTLVSTQLRGREPLGLFNPFHTFPLDLPLDRLRYMFTFRDVDTAEEFYHGDIDVMPSVFSQTVELELPVRGLVTVLDGHDYFSHHRRFDMEIARTATKGAMQSNFARFALDFVHIGEDGNTREMPGEERVANYDFRFPDARRFYSDGAPVYAPAGGEVVAVVDGQPDLYEQVFDFDAAVAANRVHDLAGNYVVIRHNDNEFSHMFHFLNGSIGVGVGQRVGAGDLLGRIGFSGAATVYSHLHYQLMDGPDFLTAQSLPARFREVTFVSGGTREEAFNVAIDTGDIILAG